MKAGFSVVEGSEPDSFFPAPRLEERAMGCKLTWGRCTHKMNASHGGKHKCKYPSGHKGPHDCRCMARNRNEDSHNSSVNFPLESPL
jgi:hypothetical protein